MIGGHISSAKIDLVRLPRFRAECVTEWPDHDPVEGVYHNPFINKRVRTFGTFFTRSKNRR